MVARYKARLVAKGYSQAKGLDCNETFAPVVKYKSLRIILALATMFDYELNQMDVQTAFLDAAIKEDVYIELPEGYQRGGARKVGKLLKALYGIKEAPHDWNEEFNSFTVSLGFTRCYSDTCVYVKISVTGNLIIITVFVDDIIGIYFMVDIKEWNL